MHRAGWRYFDYHLSLCRSGKQQGRNCKIEKCNAHLWSNPINDYNAIQNLIASYGQTVDAVPRDPEKYASYFTEDASFTDNGVTISPRSKIKALMEAAKLVTADQPALSGTRHLQFNSVIEIDGDTASATSQVLVLELSADRGWGIRGTGLYTDEIVREASGDWKFKSRLVTWFKDLGPDPLNPKVGELYASFFRSIMENS